MCNPDSDQAEEQRKNEELMDEVSQLIWEQDRPPTRD